MTTERGYDSLCPSVNDTPTAAPRRFVLLGHLVNDARGHGALVARPARGVRHSRGARSMRRKTGNIQATGAGVMVLSLNMQTKTGLPGHASALARAGLDGEGGICASASCVVSSATAETSWVVNKRYCQKWYRLPGDVKRPRRTVGMAGVLSHRPQYAR